LNKRCIERGILNGGAMLGINLMTETDYPACLASAYNKWLINSWLNKGKRYFGSLMIASQNAKDSVKEIKKLGSHPKILQVLLSAVTPNPIGQLYYEPILKVCNDMSLPLAFHPGGNQASGTAPTPTPQVSFRWHKDGGHKSHLKIMIYLNDLKKIGGGTKFVSIEDSIFLSKQGLDSKKIDARLLDLKQFADIKIFNYDISQGDVIVFQPSELFHLGEAPKALYRDHITLSIYPTDFSWRELDPKKFFSWQRHKKREHSIN